MPKQPRIEIVYCVKCRWLLRAGWMAQELLSTFPDELGEVALIPGGVGVFEIRVDSHTIWSREKDDGFPDIKTLKKKVRDRVAPQRPLGHIDQ